MTTRAHLFTLPGGVGFPASVAGLPENYPFVKDGELYVLQGGEWVLAGGGGGVAFTDTGVWTPGRTYQPGELMQYGGRSYLAPVSIAPDMVATTISDDFNRGTGILTGQTTPVGGKTWVTLHGPNANIAGSPGELDQPGSGDSIAATVVDSGMIDATLQATYQGGALMGFTMRAVDADHYFYVRIAANPTGYLGIWYRDGANGPTIIYNSNPTTISSVAGDVWSVELAGDNITVLKNGVQVGAATSSKFKGTMHGVYNADASHMYVDDFSIVGQGPSDTPDLSKFIGATLNVGVEVTASRPDATKVGAGAMFFDVTLGKPIWSTGTEWVDATGVTA